MIKFLNVCFSYKKNNENVLNDFCLWVKKGQRIWLSGPSGAGKTTILRLILGLLKANKGKVSVASNAKISVVFQEDRLIPFVSVEKNISLFSDKERAKTLLKELNLSEWADMEVGSLSGGMKRRVAIARALSKDFDILLLDEALNGLDQETAILTANIINKYLKDKTLIVVTHHKEEAELFNAKEVKI